MPCNTLLIVASIVGIVADIAVIISLLQIRNSALTLKLEAHKMIAQTMRSIPSKEIFSTFPPNILCRTEQFPQKPPKRHKSYKYSDAEIRCHALTEDQQEAANRLTDEQMAAARKCINALNELVALIEAKIVSYDDLLSSYHTQILRLLYVIEPVRRNIEASNKNSIGGNYGQRLLRLQHQAYCYNEMHPKHREVDLFIVMGEGEDRNRLKIIPAMKGNLIHQKCTGFLYKVRYLRGKHSY